MQQIFRLLPLILLLLLGIALAVGMFEHGKQNPVETRHLGKKMADFSVPLFRGQGESVNEFSSKIFAGKVTLINVFASWCEGCVAEHKTLMKLAEVAADSGKVKIYGLAWKDKPESIANYLKKHGNPFAKIGVDSAGKTTIPLALTGVPETFLLDKNGVIVFHYKSSLTDDVVENKILPLVEKLNNETSN